MRSFTNTLLLINDQFFFLISYYPGIMKKRMEPLELDLVVSNQKVIASLVSFVLLLYCFLLLAAGWDHVCIYPDAEN